MLSKYGMTPEPTNRPKLEPHSLSNDFAEIATIQRGDGDAPTIGCFRMGQAVFAWVKLLNR